jgi:hypothetical protein
MVRAKFTVSEITQRLASVPTGEVDEKGYAKYVSKPVDAIKMSPVFGPDNKEFWVASPQGSIEIVCTNPAATGQLKLGQAYYVDFSEAPETEPK